MFHTWSPFQTIKLVLSPFQGTSLVCPHSRHQLSTVLIADRQPSTLFPFQTISLVLSPFQTIILGHHFSTSIILVSILN